MQNCGRFVRNDVQRLEMPILSPGLLEKGSVSRCNVLARYHQSQTQPLKVAEGFQLLNNIGRQPAHQPQDSHSSNLYRTNASSSSSRRCCRCSIGDRVPLTRPLCCWSARKERRGSSSINDDPARCVADSVSIDCCSGTANRKSVAINNNNLGIARYL